MKIKIKGSFSPYELEIMALWIKEHLTDLSIMDKPIYAFECKISKVGKNKILVEGEKQ